MKFVALLSGGKDSCYAMHLVARQPDAHLVAIGNLRPPDCGPIELNSYMYQTVGQDVLPLHSQALQVPLFQKTIKGRPVNQQMNYDGPIQDDEVEDLYELLSDIKKTIQFDAVSCGAIHSNYQRIRAENVCQRLGVKLLSPLWGRDQKELLKEMIDCKIDAILIKTAALGLKPQKHLGQSIQVMFDELCRLNEKYGLNVCGEGGEYESMTLGCPMFNNRRVVIDEHKILTDGTDQNIAPVSYLQPIKMHLE